NTGIESGGRGFTSAKGSKGAKDIDKGDQDGPTQTPIG
ncbi:hypothetical protein A2U01_0119459, partial [Trifolium medium]|nr:hypothetical protein [Trifolium medium]